MDEGFPGNGSVQSRAQGEDYGQVGQRAGIKREDVNLKNMNDETKSGKKRIPIEEGLFVMPSSPSEKGHLIGCKCKRCGRVFFPKRNRCAICFGDELGEMALSTNG